MGWIDEVPPDVTVYSERVAVKTTGLVYTYLDYQLPAAGKINFPPGILQGSLIQSNASICGPNNTISLFMDRGTMAQVKYQLPELQKFRFNEIDLFLSTDGLPNTKLPEVSLYAWQSQAWSKFKEASGGLNIIQNPQQFISPAGEVRVQLSQDIAAQASGCLYMEMGFQGEGSGGTQ